MIPMSNDVKQCRRCKATDETQPIKGIGDDGLCLVCRDWEEKQRPSRIDERYREALTGDGSKQASLDEVVG